MLNNPGTYKNIDQKPFCVIERSLVEKLNKIIKNTNAKIVLSSSWKHSFKRRFKNYVKVVNNVFSCVFGFQGEVIDFTPNIDMGNRGDEIKKWLEEYNHVWCDQKIISFIILDDFTDMGVLKDHLVHINGAVGLSNENVNEAIKMLNEVVPYDI